MMIRTLMMKMLHKIICRTLKKCPFSVLKSEQENIEYIAYFNKTNINEAFCSSEVQDYQYVALHVEQIHCYLTWPGE